MPDQETVDPDWSRNGMHGAQAGLAASGVSHGTDCFHWNGRSCGDSQVERPHGRIFVDVEAIVRRERDPGIPGGRQMIEVAHAAVGSGHDPGPLQRLAEVVGPIVTDEIAGAAAKVEMMNRVVDGVGLPFGLGRAQQMRSEIVVLGMTAPPHAPV